MIENEKDPLLIYFKPLTKGTKGAKRVDNGIRLSQSLSLAISAYIIQTNEKNGHETMSLPKKYLEDGILSLAKDVSTNYAKNIIKNYESLEYIKEKSINFDGWYILSDESIDTVLNMPVTIESTRELAKNLKIDYNKNIRSKNSILKLYQLILDVKEEITDLQRIESVRSVGMPSKELIEIAFNSKFRYQPSNGKQ